MRMRSRSEINSASVSGPILISAFRLVFQHAASRNLLETPITAVTHYYCEASVETKSKRVSSERGGRNRILKSDARALRRGKIATNSSPLKRLDISETGIGRDACQQLRELLPQTDTQASIRPCC